VEIDLAIRRILLLYGLVIGRVGIPLIYMGDEIGLLNDRSYLTDPDKAHDSRWLHRSAMDWQKAERRHDRDTVEGRLFNGLVRLIEARCSNPHLHNFGLLHPLWNDNEHVLAYARHRHDSHLLVLGNFSEHPQTVQGDLPFHAGLVGPLTDLLETDLPLEVDGRIPLEPYGLRWLSGAGRL
jgi:amylosucrase